MFIYFTNFDLDHKLDISNNQKPHLTFQLGVGALMLLRQDTTPAHRAILSSTAKGTKGRDFLLSFPLSPPPGKMHWVGWACLNVLL